MSMLSFWIFCIEGYSKHTEKAGNEVYDLLLLKLLKSDYEDLHGMGIEYLVDFFDEYLRREKKADHSLVRTLPLPNVIELIMERYGLEEDAALDAFYSSSTVSAYGDNESGIYGQSPLYLFGLYEEELRRMK